MDIAPNPSYNLTLMNATVCLAPTVAQLLNDFKTYFNETGALWNVSSKANMSTVMDNALYAGFFPQNVSDALVQGCRPVCTTIFGQGDPDIMGMGVYITVQIQIWLTGFVFVCLPILHHLYLQPSSLSSATHKRLSAHYHSIATATLTTSMVLAILNAAAAIHKFYTSRPLLIHYYLHVSNIISFSVAMGAYIVYLFVSKIATKRGLDLAVTSLLAFVTLILFIVAMVRDNKAQPGVKLYERLIDSCATAWHMPRLPIDASENTDLPAFWYSSGGFYLFCLFLLATPEALVWIYKIGACFYAILMCISKCVIDRIRVLRYLKDLLSRLGRLTVRMFQSQTNGVVRVLAYVVMVGVFSKTAKRLWTLLYFAASCAVAYVWWATVSTFMLIRARDIVVMGTTDPQRTGQGYGQLAAVFLWMPTLYEALKFFFDVSSSKPEPEPKPESESKAAGAV